MLFRAQVRNKALQLLQAALTAQNATISTSKDTPVEGGGETPTREIIVYTVDRKTGIGTAPTTFKTEVLTTVEMTVEDVSKDAAEALMDTFCEIVENTLLGNPQFVSLFEAFEGVEIGLDYRGSNATFHTFTAVYEIKCRVTEIFEPTITDTLAGVNIYVDSVNIFDPNGAYNPDFNYSVENAPRGCGPDGRTEIGGSVELGPQLATEGGAAIEDGTGNEIIAP